MQLTNGLAAVIGFACEGVLWGVNATLFLVALVVLRHCRSRQSLHSPVIYLTCLVFLCCTTHFAIEFNHFYTTLNATPLPDFSDETSRLVGADFLISFTDLLGDIILIYRCWMLWDSYYIVILPLLTALGGFACVIGVVILLFAIDPASPAPPPALVPLGLAGYILPLCTNILVTSLIVFRIWISSRTVSGPPVQIGQGVTGRAMILVVESGLLYLLFQLVFVVLFAIQSPAEAIVAVMAVQIYGIAPTLIIIRVGMGTSSEQTSGVVVSTRLKWVARRGEDTGTSTTRYTDAFVTSTDFEGVNDSNISSSKNHIPELFQFDHSGDPSPA